MAGSTHSAEHRRLPRRGGALWLAIFALLLPAAEAPPSREEIISGMKEFQQELGFPQTRNFEKHSGEVEAFHRCYFTGKLTLPTSYEELDLRQGACTVDPEKYDVFFYRIEAVASGKAPVTASLAGASVERLMVVVPHEDFHAHKQVRKAPAAAAEAVTTLAGFLTAAEFARRRFGEDSQIHRNLVQEAELFLQKAEIVNRYYEVLSRLYERVRRKKDVSREAALEEKRRLFLELERECRAIPADPVSFNKCPGAFNNAGLAFDRTYTATYPAAYELYLAHGRDARATLAALQDALTPPPASEGQAAARLRELAGRRAGSAGPAQ